MQLKGRNVFEKWRIVAAAAVGHPTQKYIVQNIAADLSISNKFTQFGVYRCGTVSFQFLKFSYVTKYV